MAFIEIRRKSFPFSGYTLSLVLSITDSPEDMSEVSIGHGKLHHVELRRQGRIIFVEACPAGNPEDAWVLVQTAFAWLGIDLGHDHPILKRTFRFLFPGYE